MTANKNDDGLDGRDGPGGRDGTASGRSLEDHHRGQTPFGQYRWDTRTDRWAWSSGMYVLHGYPGPVIAPTTALLLEHKDTSARGRAAEIVDRVTREAWSYANYHRIVDAKGRRRTVLSVGSSVRAADGGLVAAGFMADLTEVERAAGTAAVAAASEGRAAINQAQGAVMAVFGLTPDAALAMLVWYSQNQHVKLNALCRSVLKDLTATGPISHHEQLTHLLLQAAGPDHASHDR